MDLDGQSAHLIGKGIGMVTDTGPNLTTGDAKRVGAAGAPGETGTRTVVTAGSHPLGKTGVTGIGTAGIDEIQIAIENLTGGELTMLIGAGEWSTNHLNLQSTRLHLGATEEYYVHPRNVVQSQLPLVNHLLSGLAMFQGVAQDRG